MSSLRQSQARDRAYLFGLLAVFAAIMAVLSYLAAVERSDRLLAKQAASYQANAVGACKADGTPYHTREQIKDLFPCK